MSGLEQRELRHQYDRAYFERYETRTTLGSLAGERALFYGYWLRYLRGRLSAQASLLEVGAGGGYFQKRLIDQFVTVAIDISLPAARLVRERLSDARILCADAGQLPFGCASFDAIIAFDVIEHLPRPENFLREAHRTLRSGGVLILSTPNPGSLGARLKAQAAPNADWRENMGVWHGWRDPTHVNIRSPRQWRDALRGSGFSLLREGSDFWWDTPYFKRTPRLLEKTLGNGINHLVNASVGFLPWSLGENYFAIAQRQDNVSEGKSI